MKLKYSLWIILLLVMAGSVMAETDKVMVVTYDSVEEMLMDLGKVKDTVSKPTEEKTWIKCHRYYCYEVPVVTYIKPVFTHEHADAVSKYRYNKVDGFHVNDWDEREDHYKKYHRSRNRHHKDWDYDKDWRHHKHRHHNW
jgi:hypothetical protein